MQGPDGVVNVEGTDLVQLCHLFHGGRQAGGVEIGGKDFQLPGSVFEIGRNRFPIVVSVQSDG